MDKSITGLTGLVSDFMKQLQTTSDTDSSSSQYYDEDQSAISRKRSIDDVSCRSSFASAEPAQTFVQSQGNIQTLLL